MQRIVVYMPQELNKELKAKCAISGTSVSKWFRKRAKDFLEKSYIERKEELGREFIEEMRYVDDPQ